MIRMWYPNIVTDTLDKVKYLNEMVWIYSGVFLALIHIIAIRNIITRCKKSSLLSD